MADLPPAAVVQIQALESFQKDLQATLKTTKPSASGFDGESARIDLSVGGEAVPRWALSATASPEDEPLALTQNGSSQPRTGLRADDVREFISKLNALTQARIEKLMTSPEMPVLPLKVWLGSALVEAATGRTRVAMGKVKGGSRALRPATTAEIKQWLSLEPSAEAQTQMVALESFQKDLQASVDVDHAKYQLSEDPLFVGATGVTEWLDAALKSADDAPLPLTNTSNASRMGLTQKQHVEFATKLKELTAARIAELAVDQNASKTPLKTWLASALTDAALGRMSKVSNAKGGGEQLKPATIEDLRRWLGTEPKEKK